MSVRISFFTFVGEKNEFIFNQILFQIFLRKFAVYYLKFPNFLKDTSKNLFLAAKNREGQNDRTKRKMLLEDE